MNMIVAGDGHTNIRAENSLSAKAENWSATEATCDVILTNPPFGTSEAESLTRADLALCPVSGTKGQHLFLQRMVLATVAGGDICTVIDEGVLNTESAAELRAWLLEQCKIEAVVRLPEETFKPNKINVKSSVLYMRKRELPDLDHVADDVITFCNLETLGYYGSGDPIRGYDFTPTRDQLAERIRRKSASSSGVKWQAFDVRASSIWQSRGFRLDYKFWDPEVFDRVVAMERAGTNLRLPYLVTQEIRRGKSPSADLYVGEEDGYALVVKAGTNISKYGELVSVGEEIDYVEKDVYDQMTAAHVRDGDVLLASTGDGTLGKCCVFRLSKPAIADGHVTILRPDPEKVVPEYLCDYLRVGFGSQQVQRLFSGSTGMIELTVDHIKSILADTLSGDLEAQRHVSDELRAAERAARKQREQAAEAHDDAIVAFLRGPSTPLPSANSLAELYDSINAPSIREFLRAYPGSLSVLEEAKPHVLKHFGAKARVRLRTEVEYGGQITLYAAITAPGDDTVLTGQLDRFDNDWWLLRTTQEPVVFTVGSL